MSETELRDLVADGLMTVLEASRFLSVSRATLYVMMDEGKLFHVKLGRSRRIPRKAVMNLAIANVQGPWTA